MAAWASIRSSPAIKTMSQPSEAVGEKVVLFATDFVLPKNAESDQ